MSKANDEIPLLISSLYLSNDGGAAGAGLAPITAGGFALPVGVGAARPVKAAT